MPEQIVIVEVSGGLASVIIDDAGFMPGVTTARIDDGPGTALVEVIAEPLGAGQFLVVRPAGRPAAHPERHPERAAPPHLGPRARTRPPSSCGCWCHDGGVARPRIHGGNPAHRGRGCGPGGRARVHDPDPAAGAAPGAVAAPAVDRRQRWQPGPDHLARRSRSNPPRCGRACAARSWRSTTAIPRHGRWPDRSRRPTPPPPPTSCSGGTAASSAWATRRWISSPSPSPSRGTRGSGGCSVTSTMTRTAAWPPPGWRSSSSCGRRDSRSIPNAALVRWRMARPAEGQVSPWSVTASWLADPHVASCLLRGLSLDPRLAAAVQLAVPAMPAGGRCLYPAELAAMTSYVQTLSRAGNASSRSRWWVRRGSASAPWPRSWGPSWASRC